MPTLIVMTEGARMIKRAKIDITIICMERIFCDGLNVPCLGWVYLLVDES